METYDKERKKMVLIAHVHLVYEYIFIHVDDITTISTVGVDELCHITLNK